MRWTNGTHTSIRLIYRLSLVQDKTCSSTRGQKPKVVRQGLSHLLVVLARSDIIVANRSQCALKLPTTAYRYSCKEYLQQLEKTLNPKASY